MPYREDFLASGIFPGKDQLCQLLYVKPSTDVALYNEYHAKIDALGHHTCLKSKPRCESAQAECSVQDSLLGRSKLDANDPNDER